MLLISPLIRSFSSFFSFKTAYQRDRDVLRSRQSLYSLIGILLSFSLLPVSTVSAQTKLVTLEFYGDQFRQGDTIYLKRALRRQFPHINLSQATLRGAVLVANSKRGKGRARLRVGRTYSDWQRLEAGFNRKVKASKHYRKGLDGGMHHKHWHQQRQWDSEPFWITSSSQVASTGPWQFQIKGKLRVAQVILMIDEHTDHYAYHYDRFDEHGRKDGNRNEHGVGRRTKGERDYY